ncbi:3-ketoacyl-CoA thiolase, mitochondrial [Crocuta crocuta]
MALLRGVFIVAAKRTPFGAYGGLLKDFTAIDLTEFAAKAALSAGKVSPETIDSVIVGNVIQCGQEVKWALFPSFVGLTEALHGVHCWDTRKAGCAVMTTDEVLEAGALPIGWSAWWTELHALIPSSSARADEEIVPWFGLPATIHSNNRPVFMADIIQIGLKAQGNPKVQAEQAVLLPVLLGAGIATGIGTDIGGIGSSVGLCHKPYQEFNEDMERVASSLVSLQSQISSLAGVAFQNRQALALLAAKKGGTCIFLGEECYYFEICVKDAEVVLCGGTESMSQAPYCVRNMRFGTKFGSDLKLEDTLWTGLTDQHIQIPMAITAENLAAKHNISREDCDKYALQSQQRWKAANDAGYFNNEMAPIEVKTKKGKQMMQIDEHARPQTTLEQLNKLPPVFKKEGTVTAGNASGVSDGAGAVIIASEDAVKKHNFTPLARIVGYFVSGCDPSIMGIGPVPAINGALKKTGRSLKDMDLVEVNEAFAPQYLAVQKSLDLDPSKTNVNGGAIALGHPLGGSGTRIMAHLVHELRRRGGKYAVGSACIGGGQGIAVIIESTA